MVTRSCIHLLLALAAVPPATAFGAEPLRPVDGYLPVREVTPDPARLVALAAPPERRDWWIARVRSCYPQQS